MNKPEFGGMWFDKAVEQGAVMYWGARAVINRHRGIELYRDRQGFTADDDTVKAEFFEWVNSAVVYNLEQYAKKRKSGPVITSHGEGNYFFTAEMDDRNSGGYIYVGAWALRED